jgi:hypothetical protein
MMSKSAYLYDDGDHNGPHLMFFTALKDGKNWGAGASGSPVVSGPYWFLSNLLLMHGCGRSVGPLCNFDCEHKNRRQPFAWDGSFDDHYAIETSC